MFACDHVAVNGTYKSTDASSVATAIHVAALCAYGDADIHC